MKLSDIAVTRPVFAYVVSALLIIFGIVSFDRLPLREFPNIDPPVVSVETNYRGAAAAVVETRITKLIEDRISGIEGIRSIDSRSEDGRSAISIEFSIGRDIDGAANDIRDRVFAILDELPVEADPPEIRKVDSNEDVIVWLNLASDRLTVPELTDYADRFLVDRFSVLDGVARVRIGGEQRYAMRVWIDRVELAARSLTVNDIEEALRRENIELPAGSIESREMQFIVRVDRAFGVAEDFQKLVVARGADGYLVRLGDVARVERGTEEDRTMFRGNGIPMVGLGISKQSTANTIDVARAAKREMERLNPFLPEGMAIRESFDSSVFVEGAIQEVYWTLAVTVLLVIAVIYLFLGSLRATIIPAVTVPVSVIATFIALYPLGFSVNILTLLALVLAIGLIVDDGIVVLENIFRRMKELGETPLVAAFYGTREVEFAVIATTLVLVAVFVPISFLEGDIGRLFSEFAFTLSAAVCFSSLIALTLCPVLASKILRSDSVDEKQGKGADLGAKIDELLTKTKAIYTHVLTYAFARSRLVVAIFVVLFVAMGVIGYLLPSEYTPREDRGTFFVTVRGPEGASFNYMRDYMDEIERRLLPLVDEGGVMRLLVRSPQSFGAQAGFNSGIVICTLRDWSERRSAWEIMDDVSARLKGLAGVRASPVMRQGFGRGVQKPVQFVLGGGSYDDLVVWRDIILEKIRENNPGFEALDWDYKETKPQVRVQVQYDHAAELGVSVEAIGRTLETMLGSRRVTTFLDNGEEYDVLVEGERDSQRSVGDISNIYVRSSRSDVLIPLSSLVTIEEVADASALNRYNRVRAITLEANLAADFSLGAALDHLEGLVREHLPEEVVVDFKGQSRDLRSFGTSVIIIFLLGIAVVFLVLAAQFESFIHPQIIILTVPLAVLGGLLGLLFSGGTLNLYTQVGLIVLVGIASKNGILIVEFINQLRDRGVPFEEAVLTGSATRLRPILMTAVTTVASSVALLVSTGPGSETRVTIGFVIFFGVSVATVFSLVIVPTMYRLLARNTGSPGDVAKKLAEESA